MIIEPSTEGKLLTRSGSDGIRTLCLTDVFVLGEEPLRSSWEKLLSLDQSSSFFQSPAWCLDWYHCYADRFSPYVIVVSDDSGTLGIVPLALERTSRRLAFAGDNMADYRDVVAAPGARAVVVREFLRTCRLLHPKGAFRFGPTLPESDTVEVIGQECRLGLGHVIRRAHAGWRWLRNGDGSLEEFLRKKSVRHPLNVYKRQGTLHLEKIETSTQWEIFREEFFLQHSLRQLYAGRPVSFHDSHKRCLYDSLFHSRVSHVTALRLNGRLLAAHFGYLWKEMLFWGAPSFDFREKQRSPGLLWLLLAMQKTAEWGIRGIDLTIGEGDLKERFSNEKVELPTAELYFRASDYYAQKSSDAMKHVIKLATIRLSGQTFWNQRVKKLPARWRGQLQLLRNTHLTSTSCMVPIPRAWFVFDGDVPQQWSFQNGDLSELMKGLNSPRLDSQVRQLLRILSEDQNRELYTLSVGSQLAAWASAVKCSREAGEHRSGEEPFEQSAIVDEVFVNPVVSDGDVENTFLGCVLREVFKTGASSITLCLRTNQLALRRAAASLLRHPC